MKIHVGSNVFSGIKSFLIYSIPVLLVLSLRFKLEQIHDGSLNPFFAAKMYITAFIAAFGPGYYFSRMCSRFFKLAVWLCSFVFWMIAFCYLLSYALTYNLPTESIFITVFDTTYHHTLDFLQTVPLSVYFFVFLYWGIWFYLTKTVKPPVSQKGDILYYGFLFVFFGVFCFATQWEGSFFDNARKAWKGYSDLKEKIAFLLKNEKDAVFNLESPEIPRTIVIAVGESSNRQTFNENINDFKEKTSFLKNPPLVVNDAVAVSVSTALTLKNILLPNNIPLISAYKKAGFKTFWFSNHFKSGKDDNIIYALTRNIDDRRYFNHTKTEESYEYTSQYYDDILLSPLKQALKDPSPKKIIFLHLFGSHFPYINRYPNATEQLMSDQYAASVRYTSTVLAQVLKFIESSDQNAVLLYFSDHGTIPLQPFYRPEKGDDMLNIPMFFWFSEAYRKAFPVNIEKKIPCLKAPNTAEVPFLINRLAKIEIEDMPVSANEKKCFLKEPLRK